MGRDVMHYLVTMTQRDPANPHVVVRTERYQATYLADARDMARRYCTILREAGIPWSTWRDVEILKCLKSGEAVALVDTW